MSKYVQGIIDEIRESTENEDFSDEIGLTEEEIIKFINHAQYRLHAKIIAQHPTVFTEVDTQNIVGNQEAYSLPFKTHLKNRIVTVEYSHDGSTDNYVPLRPDKLYNRDSGSNGHPDRYIRKNGEILLLPIPETSTGSLRITYIRRPLAIDKRRYLISDATPALTAGDTWDVTAVNSTSIDDVEIGKHNRVTIVDAYGNVKASNVLISSASVGSGVVLDSSYASVSGETVAQNNYIVPGDFTSTHLEFTPEVERYIHAYVEWKILKRDSSMDSSEAVQELINMEQEIVDSYADIDGDDIYEIPEINDSEDWGF